MEVIETVNDWEIVSMTLSVSCACMEQIITKLHDTLAQSIEFLISKEVVADRMTDINLVDPKKGI